MNKKSAAQSGFFNPRIFVAFVLVTFGVSLGVFSFAAPTSGKSSTAQPNASLVKPTIISSTYNAVSSAVRDLPLAGPIASRVENELGPVKPVHPVATNFVDQVVQTAMPAAATAAPTPIANFEG